MSWKGVKKQSIKADIEAWCDEMGIENYTINDKGEIDVDDDVLLMENDFKELPYKFGRVTGFFSLESCKNLISLKNCPEFIEPNHMFNIDFCSQLDSLEGCPRRVGGLFYCRGCKRHFSKDEVKSYCNVGFEIFNFN